MNFPDKLKELRKENGLTQEELASKLFVSRSLIARYENGSVMPSKENLEKLSLFLIFFSIVFSVIYLNSNLYDY